MKIKTFFSNRRNLTILISVVSFLIVAVLIVLIWMIYTKDEPKVIPEDVKGKIRKGIEDTGNAVKVVSPTVGQSIVDASFDNQPAQSSSTPGSVSISDTSDWQTYLGSGFKFNFPGGWNAKDQTEQMTKLGVLAKSSVVFITLDPLYSSFEKSRITFQMKKSVKPEQDIESAFGGTSITSRTNIQVGGKQATLIKGVAPSTTGEDSLYEGVIIEDGASGSFYLFTYTRALSDKSDLTSYFQKIYESFSF